MFDIKVSEVYKGGKATFTTDGERKESMKRMERLDDTFCHVWLH